MPKLDRLSRCLAANLGHHTEPKVDPRSDPARRDHIAILDDAGLLMSGADERQ